MFVSALSVRLRTNVDAARKNNSNKSLQWEIVPTEGGDDLAKREEVAETRKAPKGGSLP
jgi:hypothetical protein